ncbi:AraC family transcriptional regulator [Solwaraspora sp. WMMD1047]|uniref:AraC family transcriptional regulator n=1 Tax=Solwaraspora sp. WMMD1047 TaxID=3016102 RepID=UPI0024170C7F|nr:AraC family transcriptional regulator [Solwaraspora sp. WMMD1047]MDG4831237.1 AraC family transcriptional regulator [Solwaraspora sp. WMMD1047]
MSEPPPGSCRVVAWRPEVAGIAEVFHARIADYRYPRHCHDTWTVLIVDHGAIRYDLDTRHHGAVGQTVSVLPPGVVHNGYPAERFGYFRKRNLYLDPDFLSLDLVGRAVDASTFQDARLRAAISALHDRLAAPDPLDVEARLALIAGRLRRRLQRRPPAAREPEPAIADQLRQYLDGHVGDSVTLREAAESLHRSVPHLVRSFTKRYAISPHAYVVAKRVEAARTLLLRGMPAAQVASEVGFHDQAHLTRHFKRHVSITPARYAASAGIGPEPAGHLAPGGRTGSGPDRGAVDSRR